MMQNTSFKLKLVLHRWVTDLFGHNWLEFDLDSSDMGLFRPFADLVSAEGSTDVDISHRFSRHLNKTLPRTAKISQEAIMRYGDNIARHTQQINDRRDRKIEWKYYQWLSLLFTEVYLDEYFKDQEALCEQLNEYLNKHKERWNSKGHRISLPPFELHHLNKVCFQNATGSGKTLLMHVNILQFLKYKTHRMVGETILITPNEDLSEQHERELLASGFEVDRLMADKSPGLSEEADNEKPLVLFTEITKFSKEGIDPESLGNQNLIIVDEGHRGLGSAEKNKGWFRNRSELAGNDGFVFEYSATFEEAAPKNSPIRATYAKSILFDYSYRSFYKDGYGKDYRIFNLPATYDQMQFRYLTACLLAYYQQLRLYQDKAVDCAEYNLEKPLWVFVGSTVTKGRRDTKDNKDTVSDVGAIICFLKQFISDRTNAQTAIEQILEDDGQKTGLLDENGRDIFRNEFNYLKKYTASELLDDIRKQLFRSASSPHLFLFRIRGNENEVLLSTGGASDAFGLINIGDAPQLVEHLKTLKIIDDQHCRESVSQEAKFGSIHESSSPINVLIGSKRFIEGWDCWRVSTLGLMHVGKAEGAQIVQLFGRGVRLKGHHWSLKRSEFAQPHKRKPEHIQYLETLNIFGIDAKYMETFKSFLQKEGVPVMHQETHRVNLNVTYDFGHDLLILRPQKKAGCGRDYDFNLDGAAPLFGEIPFALEQKKIIIDWYAMVDTSHSRKTSPGKVRDKDKLKHAGVFSEMNIAFLDEVDLFFQLEQHKLKRGWANMNIPKTSIVEVLKKATHPDLSWYNLLVPESTLSVISDGNIQIWRDMAAELLKKYAAALYNNQKQAFLSPRLELRKLEASDANFPIKLINKGQGKGFPYEVTVSTNKDTLREHIKGIIRELSQGKDQLGDEYLKGCYLKNHLYAPLLHASTSLGKRTEGDHQEEPKIHIEPVSLNESEMAFVGDLKDFLEESPESTTGFQTFLLRNESRGKGMGFFEAGNFYPDFLMWLVAGKRQSLVFIEPHGLMYEKVDSPKIEFHKTIKDIQARLDNKVQLHSFIISPTKPEELEDVWPEHNVRNANERNVYFMNDKHYLHKIYDKVINEMRRE